MIKQLVYLLAIFFTLFSSVKPFKSFPKITSCQHSIPLVNYPLGGCSVLLAMKRAESNLKEREDAKFSARIEASKIVIPTQVSLTEISRSSGGSFEDDSLTTGLLWRGAMVLICFFWGTNYATIKDIYDSLPKDTLDPSLMLSIRFGLAALGMSFGLADASKLNKDLIQRSLFAGVIIFTGYLGQANGIIASTASKAAFFSSLNVVWVTLVSGILTRSMKSKSLAAVGLAISGAAVIELTGGLQPEWNDLWLLLQPVGFGSGYLITEAAVRKHPDSSSTYTALMLSTIAVCSSMWAATQGHDFHDVVKALTSSPVATGGLLYISLFTTAFALWMQSIAFKRVPATDASVILTMEPLMATAFASVLIGEAITQSDVTGGALIIMGCLVNELPIAFLDNLPLLNFDISAKAGAAEYK